MQFELTEEQQELGAFLQELLEQRATSTQVRETVASGAPYDPALWSVLCEQIGAASLAIPEEYGGSGFTTRETHLVLEELGRALAPSPFLGSVAIAAQAILESGNAEAAARLLPGIASGERIAALAWATPEGEWNAPNVSLVAREGDGWALSGSVPTVIDGGHAEILVAIAQTPAGPALFAVEAGAVEAGADPAAEHSAAAHPAAARVTRTVTPTLDQTIQLATLDFDEAPATLLSDRPEAIEATRLHALTAITALQIGTAARALEDTVTYSKQRTQFGRQIGSYQALKHRMADMHVLLETARTASYAAAWAESERAELAEWAELAGLAKSIASDSLSAIAGEMIQLHGGIAITWEHDAHLVFKRAHATAQLFGTAERLREERAQRLGI
ncbi:acyl-CoA dehydrogenase family protein [Leucobacter luti]|uniref:acyl-CoA dehydrogenase family protein n=1 Tax=Leucobacter luti TaxID=340320 RepID=UPI003D04FB5E